MRDVLASAIAIGAGATAFMDLAVLVRKHSFGTPSADYALVGRWLTHMPRGRFIHRPIAASPAMRGERAIGWIAHYGTGVLFAGVLLAIAGEGWVRHPAVLPALAVGIGSVAAPFLLMQPGMGLGAAARLTPHPVAARLRSLVTHLLFGVGLYGAGVAMSFWR
jgi:hypothetical protein